MYTTMQKILQGFPRKKISKEMVESEKLIATSESAPHELSNEWSCQYVSSILNFSDNFCR
jgi:hypothetical protein